MKLLRINSIYISQISLFLVYNYHTQNELEYNVIFNNNEIFDKTHFPNEFNGHFKVYNVDLKFN